MIKLQAYFFILQTNQFIDDTELTGHTGTNVRGEQEVSEDFFKLPKLLRKGDFWFLEKVLCSQTLSGEMSESVGNEQLHNYLYFRTVVDVIVAAWSWLNRSCEHG